jgi:hypothetical protein
MPAISLVVCLHRERDLLARLLREADGCFDDLVVVHDGPDETDMCAMVKRHGGRFYEQPRAYQQEPHWPFAWARAKHDWVLRLDADEYPGAEMRQWLHQFRNSKEPPGTISGYTCIWPLWNGKRAVSNRFPTGRNFLFHRNRVRFFGMVEQTPVPDGCWEALPLVLRHEPLRKSYGLVNVLLRKQAYRWRERIATSLLGKPTDLACWRWESSEWPPAWEQIRQKPLRTALVRLTRWTLMGLRDQWRLEGWLFPFAALNGPVHHALICWEYWQLQRRKLSAIWLGQ